MLNTKWETNLPGTGSATVNPLINQNGVYAGSNGYILRLDPGTGTVTAKNPLDGYGYHEVRLAAPVDGSLLVVGTYGYVLGLDPFSLSILWTTALPSSARQEVSVLCGPGGVYAGSNGYVYFLAPDAGTVMEINDLPGYGYHETRLGLITSDNYLLVGINGNTVCLDAYTLRTQWYNNMPGSGNDVTSVVGGMGVAYAACMGKVYRLNEKSGELLNGNNLSGTGSYEVRMALDSTTSRLYVGTNGYGICLNANTLATEYSASLPGCDYKVTNVTDVAVGDQKVAYFACNGYVYQLNPSGQVSGQNDLPGRDRGETRLATGHNGASELVVGIYGYAIGLNIANSPLPVDYSGKTYAVAWAPYIADIYHWRTYNPAEIDGVGMLVGHYKGKIIGDELKTKTCTALRPNSKGNSYTWVLTPEGAIIYKWWNHDDRANYVRHSQLGGGNPVICAGEFRLDANSYVESVIAMVNDASGHYKPDGGACLKYLAERLKELKIETDSTQWYWQLKKL